MSSPVRPKSGIQLLILAQAQLICKFESELGTAQPQLVSVIVFFHWGCLQLMLSSILVIFYIFNFILYWSKPTNVRSRFIWFPAITILFRFCADMINLIKWLRTLIREIKMSTHFWRNKYHTCKMWCSEMNEKTNFWEKMYSFNVVLKCWWILSNVHNFQRNVREPGSHDLRLFSCVVWWSVHRLVRWPGGWLAVGTGG